MAAGIEETGRFLVTKPTRSRPAGQNNINFGANERIGGANSAQSGYARSGNTCVRTAFVPWDTYPDAIRAILGYTTVSGGQLTRYLPYRDPVDHNMYAQAVSVRGFSPDGYTEWVPDGDTTQTPRWPTLSHERYLSAELTITYGTIRHKLAEDDDDAVVAVGPTTGLVQGRDPGDGGAVLNGFVEQRRYCIKEVRPAREFVTALPGVYCRSTSPGQRPDTPPAFGDIPHLDVRFPIPAVLSYADMVVTWLDVPFEAIPFRAIALAMGRVNDDVFELPEIPPPRYVGPETLLLQTFELEDIYFPLLNTTAINPLGNPAVAPSSRRAFNVKYYFRWRGGNSSDLRDDLNNARHPNWNKIPIPLVDGNSNVVSRYTRVFRKPAGTSFMKNAKGNPMGIFDVMRFDYLFRPDRNVVNADGSVIFP